MPWQDTYHTGGTKTCQRQTQLRQQLSRNLVCYWHVSWTLPKQCIKKCLRRYYPFQSGGTGGRLMANDCLVRTLHAGCLAVKSCFHHRRRAACLYASCQTINCLSTYLSCIMAEDTEVAKAQLIIPYDFQDLSLLRTALTAGDTNSDDREGNRGLAQVGDTLMSLVIKTQGFQSGFSRSVFSPCLFQRAYPTSLTDNCRRA